MQSLAIYCRQNLKTLKDVVQVDELSSDQQLNQSQSMISLSEEDVNEIERLGSQSNEIIVGAHNSASYPKKVASYQEGKNKYKNKGGFRWCIVLQCAAIVVLLALLTASWYKQPTEDHPIDRKSEGSPRQEDTQSGNSVNKVVQKQQEEREKQHKAESISNNEYSQKDSQNTNVVREIEKKPQIEKPAKESSQPIEHVQQGGGQPVAKEVVAAVEFPENVAKWPSESDRESTSWYKSYEDYRPNEALNLWDLSPSEKVSLLRSYQSLSQSSKPQKTDDYMQINYNKDEGFIEFQKKFQADIEVIDWSSIELTAQQEQKMKFDYDFALKERLENLQRIIKKYKTEFVGKTGYIKQEKEITYQEFITSLEYQRLTGHPFRQNPDLNRLYQREKDLHQNKYNTEQYKKELHACVVAPTYNNDVDFRYAWHLESILQQDYSNYRVVIIDDASTDQTSSKIAMHLRWRNVPIDKVILIKNKVHRTALQNIAYGIHKYCDYNQISFIIDGDDELAGTQVFKFFNAMYQRQKLYVLYTNYFDYDSKNNQDPVKLGISERYPSEIVQRMDFREQAVHSYSHLRTMITDLFFFLRKQSFLDSKGQFYWTIYDNAMYFPALEMSCGKLDYLPEMKYWYTANTGFNDWRTTKQKEYRQVKLHIQREQKKYHCIDNVFKTMHYAVSQ